MSKDTFNGGSKERILGDSKRDLPNIPAVDPDLQRLAYISLDKTRVPDDRLTEEIDQVFKGRPDNDRECLVRQVYEMRHPEPKEIRE